jgi:DNA-directed RNA polymerase III subunit RPC6
MWTRTLKARSGLHQNVIQRAIKTLEQKKLIKNVKSVKVYIYTQHHSHLRTGKQHADDVESASLSLYKCQHPTRKIYMLYNVTPSIDVTGGPWYNGNELDSELIAGLQRLAKKFIREKVMVYSLHELKRHCCIDTCALLSLGTQSLPGGRVDMLYPLAFSPYLPTAHDVLAYLNSNNVLQVDLNVEHIEALLDVLVYDNDIEKVWMKRYDADGHDVNAPPAKDQVNGVDSSKKRKRAGDSGVLQKKKKRRRSLSAASDNIDAESDGGGPEVKEEEDDDEDDGNSTDDETLKNQMEPDQDYTLPPPLANGKGKSKDGDKPHKRPGPAGNDYYWVYRTNLAAVPTSTTTNDEGERVEVFNYVYDTGLYQTPCGICPVSDLCYNRGQPKVLPLPGEKDILDLGGSAGAGYNAQSADWRSQVKVKGKFTKAKDRDEAKLKELLKMKVPAGSGEQENADGSWQGGGKVGGKVVAPVSPATCKQSLVRQALLDLC